MHETLLQLQKLNQKYVTYQNLIHSNTIYICQDYTKYAETLILIGPPLVEEYSTSYRMSFSTSYTVWLMGGTVC